MLGTLYGDIQQFILTCSLIIGYRCFVQMPHIIKLMAMNDPRIGLLSHLSGIGITTNMRNI